MCEAEDVGRWTVAETRRASRARNPGDRVPRGRSAERQYVVGRDRQNFRTDREARGEGKSSVSVPSHRVRVVRARPDGPAALAGLRDSMQLLGVDISRGDPTRQIRLRVRAGTDTTRIAYLPAGPPVTVQQWS